MHKFCIGELIWRKISQIGAMEGYAGNTGLKYDLLIWFYYFSRKMNQKVILDKSY